MADDRVHRTVSADGTEVAGRVEGQGPPLVLVQPPAIDAEFSWGALLAHLTDRFTCYLLDLRGRGLSADSPDHSPPRLHEDVNAFVDSIGEPVRLVGWSDGGSLALHAAAHSESVAALAAYEPAVWNLMREDELARFGSIFEQQVEAVTDGRPVDATHIFHHYICTDDEFDALEADYLERHAGIYQVLLEEAQQSMGYEGPQPTDPDVLGRITVPVLILLGQQTRLKTWLFDSAQHIAQHVTGSRVRELPGVGHCAPLVAPQPIAAELISFFESTQQSA